MIVVTNFSSKENLNSYLKETVENESIIKIDSVEKFYCASKIDEKYHLLRDLSSQEISLLNFNTTCRTQMIEENSFQTYKDMYDLLKDSQLYVYPWSKTIYRKSIHPKLPDSLYKRFYNQLKQVEYITAATGNYVMISHFDLSDENFNSMLNTQTIDIKALQSAISYLQENNNDTSYYISYISSLEFEINTLKEEVETLKNQIKNSSLTTWY